MENKREYVYDYLRVIACILIIGIHCTSRFFHVTTITFSTMSAIFRNGLLIFVYIRGALLLNKKQEKISDFYLNL